MQGPRSELLTIQFVQVSGQQVSGRLERYRDPECGCLVNTVFTGTLKGNVLEGTFSTYRPDAGRTVQGRWRVTKSE